MIIFQFQDDFANDTNGVLDRLAVPTLIIKHCTEISGQY